MKRTVTALVSCVVLLSAQALAQGPANKSQGQANKPMPAASPAKTALKPAAKAKAKTPPSFRPGDRVTFGAAPSCPRGVGDGGAYLSLADADVYRALVAALRSAAPDGNFTDLVKLSAAGKVWRPEDGASAEVIRVFSVPPAGQPDAVEVRILDGEDFYKVGWAPSWFLVPAPPVKPTTAPPPVKTPAVDPEEAELARMHEALRRRDRAAAKAEAKAQARFNAMVQESIRARAMGGGGGESGLCGAPTKTTGAPCRNRVKGGGRCYLHGG